MSKTPLTLIVAALAMCGHAQTIQEVRQTAALAKTYSKGLADLLTYRREVAVKELVGRPKDTKSLTFPAFEIIRVTRAEVAMPFDDALAKIDKSAKMLDGGLKKLDAAPKDALYLRLAQGDAYSLADTAIEGVLESHLAYARFCLDTMEASISIANKTHWHDRQKREADLKAELGLGQRYTEELNRFSAGVISEDMRSKEILFQEIDRLVVRLRDVRMVLIRDIHRWNAHAKARGTSFPFPFWDIESPDKLMRGLEKSLLNSFLTSGQGGCTIRMLSWFGSLDPTIDRPDLQRDPQYPGRIWLHDMAKEPFGLLIPSSMDIVAWKVEPDAEAVPVGNAEAPLTPVAAEPARKPVLLGPPVPQVLGALTIDDGHLPPNLSEADRFKLGAWRVPFPVDEGETVLSLGGGTRTLLVFGYGLPSAREQVVLAPDTPGIGYKLLAAQDDWHNPERRRQMELYWRVGLQKAQPYLPQDAPEEMAALTFMIVEVQLNAAQLSGVKRLKVNGLTTEWVLPTATAEVQVRLVRLLSGNRYEESDVFYTPERVCVEVTSRFPLPLESIPVVLGRNGEPLRFGSQESVEAQRVSPTLYRTAPFVVMLASAAQANFGNAPIATFRPRDQLNAIVPASVGFESSAGTQAVVYDTTDNAGVDWRQLLARSAKAVGAPVTGDLASMSTADAETFASRSFMDFWEYLLDSPARLFRYVFSIETPPHIQNIQPKRVATVKVGDLAAILLLRGTFAYELSRHLDTVDAMSQGSAVDHFARMVALELPQNHPLAKMPTVRGGKVTETPLRTALRPLLSQRGLNPEVTARVIREIVPASLQHYRAQVQEAIDTAKALKDDDVEGLLRLTGIGFSQIEASLTPRLMRITDDSGRPLPFWEPDPHARGHVQGVGYLALHVRGNEGVAAADTQLMLMVASLFPILAPAGAIRTVLSLAVGTLDVADVAVNQIPAYFQQRSEVKLAMQAAAVLDPQRVTEAELNGPSLLGTTIAGVGSLVGLRFDAVDLVAAVRSRAALVRATELIKVKGQSNLIELVWDTTDLQKSDLVAAAGSVIAKARTRGVSALDASEKEVWRVVVELNSPSAISTAAAKRMPRPTFLEFDGPVVPNMAKQYKKVPDAKPVIPNIEPTGVIGIGEYCTVWEYIDKATGGIASRILKIVRRPGPALDDPSTPQQIIERMLRGQELLKSAGIPHMPMLAAQTTPVPHFLQRRIPQDSETFRLFDRHTTAEQLGVERQRAVLELFSNLGKKGLVWTDAHIENIYFEKVGETWIAGVLDSDMIVKFGERDANDFVMTRLRKFEISPATAGIFSREGDGALFDKFGSAAGMVSAERVYPSASYFMMKMLERGYVRYSPISGWHGVKIDPEEVEKYFKGFRNEVTGDPIRLEWAPRVDWLDVIAERLQRFCFPYRVSPAAFAGA